VHLTEREFRATHPLHQRSSKDKAERQVEKARPPRSALHVLLILARAEATPALLAPLVVGAILGWWQSGQLNGWGLVLSLVGMAATVWGLVALWDYHDYRLSLRSVARTPDTLPPTGYALIVQRVLKPNTVRDSGRILLAIAMLCSLWLALLSGWPVLFFSGLSFLVVWGMILLPVRYGHRGWGISDLSIGVGLGLLPALTGYYVQAQTISWLPVWAGAAYGLYSMLLAFNFNAAHYRRDWLIHKRTLAVSLGPARALDISALLTIAANVVLLLMVTLTKLPLLGLLGLAALPMGLGIFARIDRENVTQDVSWLVYRTGAQTAFLSAALLCGALVIDRLL